MPLHDERPFLSPKETYIWSGAIAAATSALVGIIVALVLAGDASHKAYNTGLNLCDLQNETRTLVNGLVERANSFLDPDLEKFPLLQYIRCSDKKVILEP